MATITTAGSTASGGCCGTITSASSGVSYSQCIHGSFYSNSCPQCYSITSVPNSITAGICTCNVTGALPCPLHSYSYPAPSFTTWPPTPTLPAVDLCKEGHRITHELISDAKGLRVDFKCAFCKGCVIYSKYLVRLPKYLRTEKCLNKILNPE